MTSISISAVAQKTVVACIADAVTDPWRLVRAQSVPEGYSIEIEASAAALALPHGPSPAREQQLVVLSISRFRTYTVFDPSQLQAQVRAGILMPLAQVENEPANAFAPFVPFRSGAATLFLNVADHEFCVADAFPASWPNPFIRCQAVHGDYAASIKFSALGLGELPRVLATTRALTHRVTSCLNALKEQHNG